MNTNQQKEDVRRGGRTVSVLLVDGSQTGVNVRQLLLDEYDEAFKFLKDEIALVAYICGYDKKWAGKIAPESYEELHRAAKEVNTNGFFDWSERKLEPEADPMLRAVKADQEHVLKFFTVLATMAPEAQVLALKSGQQSTSPIGSPRPRP